MKGKRKSGVAKTNTATPPKKSHTTSFNTDSPSSLASMETTTTASTNGNNNNNNNNNETVDNNSVDVNGDEEIVELNKDCDIVNNNEENVNNEVEDEDDNEEEEYEEENEEEEEEEEDGIVQETRKRTKLQLDEGFYEIEAIRRKRVRKGQQQYLIKWKEWPETANTWEPKQNLLGCSDIIDAFEESLRSGKSSRKRKRKHGGGSHSQSKKKQSRVSTGNNSTGHEGENNGDVITTKTGKKADGNGYMTSSSQNVDEKEDNEYDPKLSELKGITPINDANADNNIATIGQEGSTPGDDGLTNGDPKVDSADTVQNSRRTGAKRRKSGFVKRFQKDSVISEPARIQSAPSFLQSSPSVPVGFDKRSALGFENGNLTARNSGYKWAGEHSNNITKIIKPISFSVNGEGNIQHALVSFMVKRSDGKEEIVDNKFLKANNPHLLIDYYEQHLKYNR